MRSLELFAGAGGAALEHASASRSTSATDSNQSSG